MHVLTRKMKFVMLPPVRSTSTSAAVRREEARGFSIIRHYKFSLRIAMAAPAVILLEKVRNGGIFSEMSPT